MAPQAQRDFPLRAEAGDGEYAVDDGNWHLVAGVVDAESDPVTVAHSCSRSTARSGLVGMPPTPRMNNHADRSQQLLSERQENG